MFEEPRISKQDKLKARRHRRRGQATTEYVIILVIMTSLVVFFAREVLRPWIEETLNQGIKNAFEEQAFPGPDYRDFPLGRP